MKKSFALLLAAAVLPLLCCSCASAASTQTPAPAVEKKLRVGLFVDNGASGNGLFHLAGLIAHSPQAELVTLMGSDIRAGKLKDIDVLVMPGGGSRKQCNAIGNDHLDKVRDFLRNGGGYVGTCAGMFNVLECRMKLLPFDRYLNAGGSTAWVSVEVNQDAAKILDIKPGIRKVRYSGGPVSYALANSKSEGKGISLGVYKSSVSRSKEQEGKFIGSPAWIYGSYGKGKVIATSFHPEYEESTHDMMLGCFYAVSGVKLTPVFPKKNYRPVRVGLLTSYVGGHKPIELMLDLERHPDIDLDYVMATELDKGILKHLDVLVVPSPQKAMLKKFFATDLRKKQFAEFMNNGGVILDIGEAEGAIQPHKNFIKLPKNADVKKYILK